jgi:hypothetical protein
MRRMSRKLANDLQQLIAQEGATLRAISEEQAATRPGGGTGWTRKQELGHLLDSATNNRVRFIRAALEGRYTGPTYDGIGWVDLGGYANMQWSDLVQLWEHLNRALGTAIARIPEEKLAAPCRVGEGKPVSLEFLIEDYILHMKHHLDHILARKQMTAYPGAALGI